MNLENPLPTGSDDHEAWFEDAVSEAQCRLTDALSETFRSLKERLHQSFEKAKNPHQSHTNPPADSSLTPLPSKSDQLDEVVKSPLNPASPYSGQTTPHPQESPEETAQAHGSHPDSGRQNTALPHPVHTPPSVAEEKVADYAKPLPIAEREVETETTPEATPDPTHTSSFFPGQQTPADPSPAANHEPAPISITPEIAPPQATEIPVTTEAPQLHPSPLAHEAPAPFPAPTPVLQSDDSAEASHAQTIPTPDPQTPLPEPSAPLLAAVEPSHSPFLAPADQSLAGKSQEGLAPGIADALPPSSPVLSKEAQALAPPETSFLPGVPPNPTTPETRELDAALGQAFDAESRPKTSEIYRPGENEHQSPSPIASPFEQVIPPQQSQSDAHPAVPASLFEPPVPQQLSAPQQDPVQQQPAVPQQHSAPQQVDEPLLNPAGTPFPSQPPHAEFPPRPVTPLPEPSIAQEGIFPQAAPAPQGPFELTSPPADHDQAAVAPQQFPGQPRTQNRGVLPQAPGGEDVILKGSNDS